MRNKKEVESRYTCIFTKKIKKGLQEIYFKKDIEFWKKQI